MLVGALRCSLSGLLVVMLLAAAAEPATAKAADLKWHDVRSLPLEGRGWSKTAHPYDRLPAHAEAVVRKPVWELAKNSAGLSVRFVTNATQISARWKLRSDRVAMSHMAATGVSGLDLYIRHEGQWKFLAVARPEQFPSNEKLLVRGLTDSPKEFRLYFPLYNGVDQIEIGLPAGATFESPKDSPDRAPVVFYGTSITQGGCASRPGMAYPAILGRHLDVPTINLGFSGNGKTEPELAKLLAELSPAAFVLDSLANLETRQAEERLPVFLKILRERHPDTPIILVENFPYPNTPWVADRKEKMTTSNEFLKAHYERCVAAGDKHLYYVPADELIGADGEATVDALHPTDAGFLRMAAVIEPVLRQALAPAAAK